jgi:hypothetical protein
MGTIAPAIVGLFGVLIGAAISMGTAYLLALRKEATDDRNWRRDHALEAYSDVLKASETVHFVAIAAYIADCNTEEHVKHTLLVRDAISELHGVVDRVLLLSPKEMYDDLRSLVSYCTGEIGINSIECPKIATTEWDKIQGAGFVRVHNNFTLAARNDLGIHVPHFSSEQLMRFNQEWRPGRA